MKELQEIASTVCFLKAKKVRNLYLDAELNNVPLALLEKVSAGDVLELDKETLRCLKRIAHIIVLEGLDHLAKNLSTGEW